MLLVSYHLLNIVLSAEIEKTAQGIGAVLESKQNSKTVRRGFKILLYTKGLLHKPQFIAKVPDKGYIIGLQKKSVAIYAIEKKRLQDVHENINPEIEIL